MKKILVLGGTGAMGRYLVPMLAEKGYYVDVVALDTMESDNPNINYRAADASDDAFITELMKNGYEAVVDFMIYYNIDDFKKRYKIFLDNTKHYIYLSTYRIYANEEVPITENSPRLLDASDDKELLASADYCIYKAQGEDVLKASGYNNWTIIRPAITYSTYRNQLVTIEAYDFLPRVFEGKTIILPEGAMDVQATMSWAGDVAKMIAALVLNEKAYTETYTVSTAEHHTWREVAEIYKELVGLKYHVVDNDTFLNVMFDGAIGSWRQLYYDRMFERVIDNSKILEIAGMKQEELMGLKEGLKLELAKIDRSKRWWSDVSQERMDRVGEYLKSIGIE